MKSCMHCDIESVLAAHDVRTSLIQASQIHLDRAHGAKLHGAEFWTHKADTKYITSRSPSTCYMCRRVVLQGMIIDVIPFFVELLLHSHCINTTV